MAKHGPYGIKKCYNGASFRCSSVPKLKLYHVSQYQQGKIGHIQFQVMDSISLHFHDLPHTDFLHIQISSTIHQSDRLLILNQSTINSSPDTGFQFTVTEDQIYHSSFQIRFSLKVVACCSDFKQLCFGIIYCVAQKIFFLWSGIEYHGFLKFFL